MSEEFVVLRLEKSKQTGNDRKSIKSANISVVETLDNVSGKTEYGAIAMLEPPQKKGLKLRQFYVRLKYWLKDRIDPCEDPGGNMEVCTCSLSIL